MMRKDFLVLLLFALSSAGSFARPARHEADVVVYGGTASGVMTAYSAAKDGMKVILLEPGSHLGGMVTGGLSGTDTGHFQIIGGYARDFYMEAASHYGVHELTKRQDWLSEPHVDEAIFASWLRDTHVEVVFHQKLREKNGVTKQRAKITQITTEDGQQWKARVFADCSYEGDLMAQAGISYVVGRESTEVFHEGLAGVRTDISNHQFLWPTSAYDSQHRLWPNVNPGPLGTGGSGDKKVQSYNFRLILTNDPGNRLPWTKPTGYNSAEFGLLGYYLSHYEEHQGHTPTLRNVMLIVPIPNHKADFNNYGAFSTDYIGKSWTYPDAKYAERKRIWDDHMLYTQSLFYFLATDSQVPADLRAQVNEWGRPKDEYEDTDHWPNQLYVREGRRMMGEYVMKQSDLQTERTKPDSIGMGSYNSDSHNVDRIALPDGTVRNEGNVEVPVEPYEIAYGSILPRRGQAENLLVPVCLSASHTAYSSVRMEPQYMIVGQAAGSAAAIAVRANKPVQDVSIEQLQAKLREHHAILHLEQQAGK